MEHSFCTCILKCHMIAQPPSPPSPHFGLDGPLVVIDQHDVDVAAAVGSEARGEEELLVRFLSTLRLTLPPAGRVVGDGTVLVAVQSHVTAIVCEVSGLIVI